MDSAGYGTKDTTASEKALNQLMHRAETFITKQRELPLTDTIKVGEVFTAPMFAELKKLMVAQKDSSGKSWVGIEETEKNFVNGMLPCICACMYVVLCLAFVTIWCDTMLNRF